MKRFLTTACLMAGAGLLPVLALHAQQAPPTAPASQPAAKSAASTATKASSDPIERIKEEGSQRSQVMATMSYLTDVIGPRLTGSPNMKRANEWTRDKLAAWGLANAHLEAWGPFGRGWTLKRFSAQVVSPQCIPLIGFPKAWSPGVEGTLEAPVVYFDAKTEAEFEKFKGKLKGAIVLVSPIREVAARLEPLAARKTDSELLGLADAAEAAAQRGGRRAAGTGPWCGRRRASGAGGSRGARTAPEHLQPPVPQPQPGRRGRFMTPEMHGPDGASAEEDPVPGRPGSRHAASSPATRATAARSSSSRRASPARAASAAEVVAEEQVARTDSTRVRLL